MHPTRAFGARKQQRHAHWNWSGCKISFLHPTRAGYANRWAATLAAHQENGMYEK